MIILKAPVIAAFLVADLAFTVAYSNAYHQLDTLGYGDLEDIRGIDDLVNPGSGLTALDTANQSHDRNMVLEDLNRRATEKEPLVRRVLSPEDVQNRIKLVSSVLHESRERHAASKTSYEQTSKLSEPKAHEVAADTNVNKAIIARWKRQIWKEVNELIKNNRHNEATEYRNTMLQYIRKKEAH